MPISRRIFAASFAAITLAAPIALTACSTGTSPQAAEPSTSDAVEHYPLVLDNCGTTVSFDAAPERVLAIKSTSIEMLLALGLDDHVIGTAFPDGPAASAWSDRAEGLPLIDEKVPGQEATLDLEPDLVYAGWESNVSADGAGDRDTLASLGVNTYVSPSACQKAGYQPNPLTFTDVFTDISEMGEIFDVSDRSDALVSGLRQRLDDLTPDGRELTALWFSSGSDTPFVGAGIGAAQMIMDAAGLSNIAEDIPETWSSVNWEFVVEANPDVIVLVDSAWSTTARKIEILESNPATAQLDAVRQSRYLIVPFPTTEAGVRNVEAVEIILDQLGAMEAR